MPISSGSVALRPLAVHEAKLWPCQTSPRLSRISSGIPLRTSFWALASVATGAAADRPELLSDPAELLT